MSLHALPPADLRLTLNPAELGFADTSELAELALPWIGQQRAEAAARFGLGLEQPGYNLLVLGEIGSGRSTLLTQLMHELAASRAVPPDLCFLHNFDTPERPMALRLPAGQGRELRQGMAELAKRLREDIPRRLAEPFVKSECERLEAAAKADEDRAYAALAAFAEARRFGLLREQGNLVFTQLDAHGKPMTAEAAMGLSPEQHAEMATAESALRTQIAAFLDTVHRNERTLEEALVALRRRLITPLLEDALEQIRKPLRKQIKDGRKLGRYLEQVQAHVLENLDLFHHHHAEEDDGSRAAALTELLARLRVNVAVDNHELSGAPVLVVDNPVHRVLFGSIEYELRNDVLVSDFARIRAGSLLRAHGGFLMLHLCDLLGDPQVWESLRRFVRSGRLQIEEPGLAAAPLAAVSLQPEAVDVDVKLVLVASVEEYYALQDGDPELARRFGCKVDFAESFEANAETRHASAILVAQTCRRLGLPPANAAAVAALIEESHRDAEDQLRQSARFARTEALLVEAAALARARQSRLVVAEDVWAARAAARHRHDYPEQRLQEAIRDGERVLVLQGERVGQLNGLTVIDLGDHAFGLPVRVSARSHAGEDGLLNIEREVELSGPIHDKGVLILQSYLTALFAHLAPLALNASLVFEQEYQGVEGDSASCAELCALLSALSGVPLRQGIAVTGALNQHGELLPVGGINEKIEGYFRTCAQAGLDGQQGVLIPSRNRRHLMLSPEVTAAVAAGRFQVYAADCVADVLGLLSPLPVGADCSGSPGPQGYPPGTLLGQAQRQLQAYRRACGVPEHGPRPDRGLRGLHPRAQPTRKRKVNRPG
ncbi:Lon protease family protein [Inhella proteolytica]|uniref:endopeptidase La n=1 Tax=Inhella proteolytica TaxID=2795029 RepID=A0A931IY79_9BURK|nr:ATP-binding protein [Inhella proteolytica]MBH9575946.1 AAA family ATPase [Inhella proteolytica]